MTELLKQAALLLAREATRLPSGVIHSLQPAAREGVAAAQVASPPVGREADLRRQVHEIISSLLNLVGEPPRQSQPSFVSELRTPSPRGGHPGVTISSGPLTTREELIPLLHCDSAVSAGSTAHSRLRILNDSDSPCPATLYCSNFITDTGYEIPAVCVSFSPRQVAIPAQGASDFEIAVAVPEQTPAGRYAGLIRAMGSRHFQVVLSVEVS